MRNLLNFLARYNNLIIFILLEGLSFYYLATRNNYHNARLMFAFKGVTQGFESRLINARTYFNLNEINRELAKENIALKNRIQKMVRSDTANFISVFDTINAQEYQHISAEVIDNSVNRQKNFFTINKGIRDGIKKDMAVISYNGVAGVIVGSSANYSVAMSLLNLDFKVSARLKSNGYFGSLNWDGHDATKAQLKEIPQHVPLNVGDTIETTGYSAIFPEGIIVGTISDFSRPGGDFYNITIRLSTDFRKLHYVDIIGYLKKNEITDLQNQVQ
ncbi:MAG TPA: rod shape-determining protein MreC [Bacteroidales bacterium]|nr:rod shape-determining protein MreC [Bacteroidales bacterium]